MDTTHRPRRASGPKTQYPGKVRARPTSVALTPEGHAALAIGMAQAGLSRSDYIERLLRRAVRAKALPGADRNLHVSP